MRWMRLMPFPGRIPPQASSESGVRLLGPVYIVVGTSGRWGNPPVHVISYFSWSRLHDKWGDPPNPISRGDNLPCKRLKVRWLAYPGSRSWQKAQKRNTYVLKLCTFPSRLMAEIGRNHNRHASSVKCSHFWIFSVVNRPDSFQTISYNVLSQ